MLLQKLLVLGDSHSLVFQDIDPSVKVVSVGGATAQGAVNPNSVTHALNIFTEYLSSIDTKQYDMCLIHLGEVDCNFVIWYRSQKHNITIQEQVMNSINNLFTFVQRYIEPLFLPTNIVIVAPHLPKVIDYQKAFTNIANERKKVNVSLQERTRLTLEYSSILAEKCQQYNYKYLDTFEETLDAHTGLLKAEMLNENQYDIHISHHFLKKIYCEKIKSLVLDIRNT